MTMFITRLVLIISFIPTASTVNAHAQSVQTTVVATTTTDSIAPHIETFDLESKVFGNTRTIKVFLPESYNQPGHEDQRYPVLYLNDGFAVFKPTLWNAPRVVMDIARQKKISEIILVGIDNGATARGGSPDQRTNEYLPYADTVNEPTVPMPHGDLYPDFLIHEVVPAVAARYRIKMDKDNIGIGGSSYGALAALYTVIHRPGMFGRLLLESTPTFMARDRIMQEAQACREWPIRVYIGIGTKETPDEKLNNAAIPKAQELRWLIVKASPGTAVKLLVGEGDAHNAKAWSRRLPEALEFLFRPER